jgi:hypothetical protein
VVVERLWEIKDFDVCVCGDYRHQHVNGIGKCTLGSLCTPSGCQKFRLHYVAMEVPSPSKSGAIEAAVQRTKEACAMVADRAAERYAGNASRAAMAEEIATSIRALIPAPERAAQGDVAETAAKHK